MPPLDDVEGDLALDSGSLFEENAKGHQILDMAAGARKDGPEKAC